MLQPRKSEASVVVSNFIDAMSYVWGQRGTDETPRLAKWAATILTTLYEKQYTLAEALYLTDRSEQARALSTGVKSPVVQRNWENADALRPSDLATEMASTANRFQRFVSNRAMRLIFGQPGHTLNMARALDEGWIVLVNLSREGGRIGREDADLFATLLLADLWTAAQERGKHEKARPCRIYLDEFQRFVSPTMAENLDEARGYGLQMVMAHQFPKQLLSAGEAGQQLYDSIMVNARSKVAFHLAGKENLEPIADWLFRSTMNPDEVKLKLYSTTVQAYRDE